MNLFRTTASLYLSISLLAGCGTAAVSFPASTAAAASAEVQIERTPESADQGYLVNPLLTSMELPEDAQTALDKASEAVTEAAYVPIALLARQNMNGTNYSILCRITPADPESARHLDVVTVCQDTDGNIEDMTIAPFELADVTDADHTYSADQDTDGGFVINSEDYTAQFTGQDINEGAAAVFDRAKQTLENNTGDAYSYIAELESDSLTSKHAFLGLKNEEDPD
ncbi:MAG: hypothetical protein ACI4WR_07675 [Bulleidia sp.]